MSLDQQFIRNFSIIAHIDHGKSTLADRLIEFCGGLEKREMREQVLDSMDIEKERGITIKSQTVRLKYKAKNGNTYFLNLIDTPGHVDFSYEVSRALSACEGSLLVVDASQGVEAQTLANLYQAIERDHEIVTIINKIDLPAAEPDKVKKQIEDMIGIDTSNAVLISAKNGIGIDCVLESIVNYLPAPKNTQVEIGYQDALKGLLIDSWYDKYLGVVILVRIVQGVLTEKMKIRFMSTKNDYFVENIGYFTPKKTPTASLTSGEIGFFTAGIKQVSDCRVGDTIIEAKESNIKALPGFKPNKSVVFSSLYPADASQFAFLKDAIEKLHLNDSSIEYQQENSTILGFGFRCGFLGLLHLEIVQERLSREFDIDIITTAPSVNYKINMKDGNQIEIHNATQFPDIQKIDSMLEPWINATIISPDEYLGSILGICVDKRGIQSEIKYIMSNRVMIIYKLPLNEVVFDFYDKLKSATKGFASFDWEMDSYQLSDLVKLIIMINGEVVDALSTILHKSRAESRGREICERLKDLIPRQMFQIAIQAAIGGRIIARETVKALRKDVLAKCYGGDITRKRKLLEKQKEGKKRMRNIGQAQIPQSAFIDVLKTKT